MTRVFWGRGWHLCTPTLQGVGVCKCASDILKCQCAQMHTHQRVKGCIYENISTGSLNSTGTLSGRGRGRPVKLSQRHRYTTSSSERLEHSKSTSAEALAMGSLPFSIVFTIGGRHAPPPLPTGQGLCPKVSADCSSRIHMYFFHKFNVEPLETL